MQTLLPGITAERVPASRLNMAVLSVTGRTGQPVLFLHGNVSSSLFWQPAMLALPEGPRCLEPGSRRVAGTLPGAASAEQFWRLAGRRRVTRGELIG